jgi:hypothetical protein
MNNFYLVSLTTVRDGFSVSNNTLVVACSEKEASQIAVRRNAVSDFTRYGSDEFIENGGETSHQVDNVELITDPDELKTLHKYLGNRPINKSPSLKEAFVCIGRVCDMDDQLIVVSAETKDNAKEKFKEFLLEFEGQEQGEDIEVYIEFIYSIEELSTTAPKLE